MPRILSLGKYFASNYNFLLEEKKIIIEYEYAMILDAQLMPAYKFAWTIAFIFIRIFICLVTKWIIANTVDSISV